MIKQIIPAYVKHGASEEDAAKVEEHLCVCHDCREFLSSYMDKPVFSLSKQQNSGSSDEKKIGLFEYVVLAVGIVILFFFVLLLIKG